MVSNIDETKPATGIDQPVQVIRDNFAAAKVEIEALQSSKVDRNGDTMLGILQFAPITLASLPNPAASTGGMLFVTDGGPAALFFSDGTDWLSVLDPIAFSLVNDLTPQLGGNLDVNGRQITGDVILNPDTDVDVSTSKIVNVVDPTADQDAATKNYVDDKEYATKNFAEPGDSFVINSKHQLIVYQEYIVETGGTLTIEPNAALVIL